MKFTVQHVKLSFVSKKKRNKRVSYNGNTLAFQARAGGSIPPTRSYYRVNL